MPLSRMGVSLTTLVEQSERVSQIYKLSLRKGDCLLIQTLNSVYTVRTLDDGWFEISGGWFDRKGESPMKVRINGCTWGGSAIKIDIAAAHGLSLEFSNRVVTSPIQKVVLLPYGTQN